MSAQLDREAQVAAVGLEPGLYRVVFLSRDGNRGEVYFFAGRKVKPNKAVAVAQVEAVEKPKDVAAVEVQYAQERSVTGIVTPGQSLADSLREKGGLMLLCGPTF